MLETKCTFCSSKLCACWRSLQPQPNATRIYVGELELLQLRRKIGHELTDHQNQALDQFLREYSDELMHIAAWIAHQTDSTTRMAGDPSRLLQQSFEDHPSSHAEAITNICQQMVASLFILRPQARDTQSGFKGDVGWGISRPIRAEASL